MAVQRQDGLAVGAGPGRPVMPIIRGCDGAVDIGIEQADLQAHLRQRHRQIGGDGGFADPALARGHRHDRLDPGDRPAARPAASDGGRSSDPAAGPSAPPARSPPPAPCRGRSAARSPPPPRRAPAPSARPARHRRTSITKRTWPPSTVSARIQIRRHQIAPRAGIGDPGQLRQHILARHSHRSLLCRLSRAAEGQAQPPRRSAAARRRRSFASPRAGAGDQRRGVTPPDPVEYLRKNEAAVPSFFCKYSRRRTALLGAGGEEYRAAGQRGKSSSTTETGNWVRNSPKPALVGEGGGKAEALEPGLHRAHHAADEVDAAIGQQRQRQVAGDIAQHLHIDPRRRLGPRIARQPPAPP